MKDGPWKENKGRKISVGFLENEDGRARKGKERRRKTALSDGEKQERKRRKEVKKRG